MKPGRGKQKNKVTVKNEDTNEPIEHAKVCLTKTEYNNDIQEVAYTDPSGDAYFTVQAFFGGTMKVTVTKHNHIPYQENIEVSDNGATLEINPTQGPKDIYVDLKGYNFGISETVDIYFGSTSIDTRG